MVKDERIPTLAMMMGFRPFILLKKFLPRSLFGRFLIILVTPLLLVQVVLGYIFFDRHTDTILRLLSDTIAGDVALVKTMVEEGKPIKTIQHLAGMHLHLDLAFSPQAHLKDTGQAKDAWLYDHMAKALEEQLKTPFFLRMDRTFIYMDVESKNGVLHIKTLRKRLFSKTTPLVLIWTTASAFLLFLVAMLFMRNQIKPITRLADAAEKFGKGQPITRFKPEGALEVRKAAHAFNQMRQRIQRFVDERTLQLAGVSHDLRTPLTRMQLQLALMPQNEDVLNLQKDIDHMTHMVQGFLDFARGSVDELSRKMNIQRVIQEVIDDFRKSHHIKVHFVCKKSENLFLKPHLFNRMLTNILINCEKYGDKAVITLVITPRFVEIKIDDDGPGIPAEKMEDVFQPFYRLDTSRSAETGGAGLGLTIVRDVMHMHGGKAQLGFSPLGGLRVTLSFPR